MLDEIMDAVTRRLDELFGGGVEIYTDAVEQDLKEPCFFVQFLEPSEKPRMGCRYYREMGVCIQYLPKDSRRPSRECNRVADCLMDGMEYITLADGSLVRGTGRRHRVEDKVLSFFVNYNLFVRKEEKKEEPMETMEMEKGMVK